MELRFDKLKTIINEYQVIDVNKYFIKMETNKDI